MDSNETARLWEECQRAKQSALCRGLSDDEAHSAAAARWNAWADSLAEERCSLEASGQWQTETDRKGDLRGANAVTADWLTRAKVDFGLIEFQLTSTSGSTTPHTSYTLPPGVSVSATLKAEGRAIDFRGFRFPGKAEFSLSVFSGWAWFEGASFDGPALFAGVRVLNWIGFESATFRGRADFHQADFFDHAVFTGSTFGTVARFDLATFHQLADFRGVEFLGDAGFFAITCERGLLFGATPSSAAAEPENRRPATTFHHLPDFIQSSFREAPVLDNTNLRAPDFVKCVRRKPSAQKAARYRALRRLATESHSYSQELDFLAEELRAIRDQSDGGRMNILNRLYEQASDFGRSLARPLRLMSLFLIFFSLLYYHFFQVIGDGRCSGASPCVYLALLSSLPWSGVLAERSGVLTQLCLGDVITPERYFLDTLIVIQVAISIVLWFLFLLAVRNRFRIG